MRAIHAFPIPKYLIKSNLKCCVSLYNYVLSTYLYIQYVIIPKYLRNQINK